LFILVTPAGGVWIGPSECWLAQVNGQLVGVVLDHDQRLLICARQATRVPMHHGTSRAFMEVLAGIDRELEFGR
jgi:hypothetical protein